jgi:hypothetical protein
MHIKKMQSDAPRHKDPSVTIEIYSELSIIWNTFLQPTRHIGVVEVKF